MILLRDCPFCGGDEVAIDYDDKHIEYEICGAIVHFRWGADDINAVARAWNDRADDEEARK